MSTQRIRRLLTEPSDSALEEDIYVAAVYLGRKADIKRWIAEGMQSCRTPRKAGVTSQVFGNAFSAATFRGDFGIIELLLSGVPEYNGTGILSSLQYCNILFATRRYGHQAAFNFAMDAAPLMPQSQSARISNTNVRGLGDGSESCSVARQL
jgi:hypothetical protein